MNQNWETRIIHLGLGRFHRGHQAVYFQHLSEMGDSRWGVVSFSMRSSDVRDQMIAVNLKYPVIELSAHKEEVKWVESIREVHAANSEINELIKAFENPQIEIVTITVTERGYSLDSQGKFNINSSEIQSDLKHPKQPQSAIGILALGLQARSQKNLPGLSVISCDNLKENGHKVQDGVESYLSALGDRATLNWLKTTVTFLNTMVDRIVPALTQERTLELESKLDVKNSGLIATEEFSQWIIEDNFQQARPPWDKVGVQFVEDVRPFEEIKLKLLNASHSYLSFEGQNRGYQFVHEAINDKDLSLRVQSLYGEVIPLLHAPSGYDLHQYTQRLIERFKNNKSPHQLKQIAVDGSIKLTQRIIPSLEVAILKDLPRTNLIQVIASWLNYCWKFRDELNDPMKNEITHNMTVPKEEWAASLLQTKMFSPISDHKIQLEIIRSI